jgi:phosphatidate cytidylyltransferase
MFFLRLITWIVLVGLFFSAVFIKEQGRYILLVMSAFLAFVSTHEVLGMFEKLKYKSFKRVAAFFAALSVIFIFVVEEKYNLIPFSLFAVGCWGYLLVCGNKEENLKKMAVSVGGALLAILPIFFLSKIYYNNCGADDMCIGAKRLLYLVAVTKTGDTFAYITGMLSNKILKGKNHKIVPAISPKKSWEGTIGGMIFSVITSFILYKYLFDIKSLFIPITAGIFLFWGGFFGDLAESALKRTCGVKDSGSILPGMGGVYDLLDSFIFNAPLFYFCIILF